MDVYAHNRQAWNRLVAAGDRWTRPVSGDQIARARRGDWSIVLTPTRPVPREWFPALPASEVLCLASGGGQQGPLLAATGAEVTVLDASPLQLAQDRAVAEREGLALRTVEGDMAQLSMFGDAAFDLIVHPCSNCFVPRIHPVWRESYRVLRPGGLLLAGFTNPVRYLFDQERVDGGDLEVCHRIPYADWREGEPSGDRDALVSRGEPLEFGHSLEDQLGGQTAAGLTITALYEDRYDGDVDPLSRYLATFMATRAVRR